MRRCLPILIAVALSALATPAAHAAGWSRAWSVRVAADDVDRSFPRVAIGSDGTSVAAFERDGNLVAVTGDRRGRFGAPQRLGRVSSGVTAGVAAGSAGRALVVWRERRGIYVAVRTAAGRPLRRRLLSATSRRRTDLLLAVADPRGGWFVVEHRSGVPGSIRGFTLRPDGTLALRPRALGRGRIELRSGTDAALAVNHRGQASLVFNSPDGAAISGAVHHGAWGPARVFGGPALHEPRVAIMADGNALVAATHDPGCSATPCRGAPVAAEIAGGWIATPFAVPEVAHPSRVYGPSIAPLGDRRAVLVYAERSLGQPRLTAGVRAVVLRPGAAPGPVRTLAARAATEPLVLPLSDDRALALWAGSRGFGAALVGADGAIRRVAEPKGPPPRAAHLARTNRDFATAGRYAIVGWSRDGRVRLSVRRF